MAYTYFRSEPGLWTVGFYNPSGKWEPESDHNDKEEAAKRAAWLNGSPNPYEVDFSRENKELSEKLISWEIIGKRVKFMFGNEANYPEGSAGYNIAKQIEELLNRK